MEVRTTNPEAVLDYAQVIEKRIERRVATRREYRALDRHRRRGPHPGDQYALLYAVLVSQLTKAMRPFLRLT